MRLGSILVAVLLLAAGARCVAYLEIENSSLLYFDHWSEADMSFYRESAREIRHGDLLSARPLRPYHSWHANIARTVHDNSGSLEPFDDAVGRKMWNQWLGDKAFYEDPLYSYLLAGLYSVFGESIHAVWLAQSILGLAIVALVVVLAERLFGTAVALVAGVMAALFGPLIFYEAMLLRSVQNTLAGLVTLLMAILALERDDRCTWFLCGVSFGVGFLAQSTALMFAAFVAAIAVFRRPLRAGGLRESIAPYLLGFLVGTSPLVARNLAVGIFPLQPAANGVVTFINQNAGDSPAAGGYFVSKHAPDIMSRSGGRALPAMIATVSTHRSVASWLVFCGRKVMAFWHWYEIPNNGNYYYWLLYAGGVGSVALTFASIGPLGAAGLVFGARRTPAYAAAVAFIASGILISGLFLTLSRLRLPFACALIPFAAFTLVSVARWLASGSWARAGAAVLAVAAAALVCLRPLPRGHSPVGSADYGTGNEIVHHLATRRAAADDVGGALAIVEHQIAETEPDELRRLEPAETTSRIPLIAAETAGSFLTLHELAAELAAARRETERAAEHSRRANVLRVVAAQWERAQQKPGKWLE